MSFTTIHLPGNYSRRNSFQGSQDRKDDSKNIQDHVVVDLSDSRCEESALLLSSDDKNSGTLWNLQNPSGRVLELSQRLSDCASSVSKTFRTQKLPDKLEATIVGNLLVSANVTPRLIPLIIDYMGQDIRLIEIGLRARKAVLDFDTKSLSYRVAAKLGENFHSHVDGLLKLGFTYACVGIFGGVGTLGIAAGTTGHAITPRAITIMTAFEIFGATSCIASSCLAYGAKFTRQVQDNKSLESCLMDIDAHLMRPDETSDSASTPTPPALAQPTTIVEADEAA